jgi:hypothetical protein
MLNLPNWPGNPEIPPAVIDKPTITEPSPVAPPTTTTVATVTTTVTPAATAVPWMQSLKFRAYLGGWLTLVIGWAVENLTTHQFGVSGWTWIALAVSTLLTIRSIVGDWMNPNVTAPFAVLNKDNITKS